MSRSLQDLSPEARAKCIEFQARARAAGIDVLVYHTFRTEAEHAELWAQGRTKPGPKVTWTKTSRHMVRDKNGKPASDAWDCVPMINGKTAWNAKKEYLTLGKIAQELGLRWGGNFDMDDTPFEKGECDSPHFELIRK